MSDYSMRYTSGKLKYETREELGEAIDEYFTVCENDERPRTVPGLAVHLDLGVDTLMKYGARDQFGDLVHRALDRIEAWLAEACFERETVQGAKFNLATYRGRIEKLAQVMQLGNGTSMLDELLNRQEMLKDKLVKLGPDLRSEPSEIIEAEIEEDNEDQTEGKEGEEA